MPDLTKADLIKHVAVYTQLSQAQAREAVDTLADFYSTALTNGLSAPIPGVGTLKVKSTAEKTGKIQGRIYTKPAGCRIVLSLSKALKEAL